MLFWEDALAVAPGYPQATTIGVIACSPDDAEYDGRGPDPARSGWCGSAKAPRSATCPRSPATPSATTGPERPREAYPSGSLRCDQTSAPDVDPCRRRVRCRPWAWAAAPNHDMEPACPAAPARDVMGGPLSSPGAGHGPRTVGAVEGYRCPACPSTAAARV
jgi:hypothetical protein